MFSRTFGDIPLLIAKEAYLPDAPIHIDRIICGCRQQSPYALSTLHEHPFIEISYVEKGTGIHTVWNESYPVTIGNLFVLNSSVPHGLYSVSETDPLIVRSLYFDPCDLLGGEIVEIGNPQYLYGLFNNHNFVVSLTLKTKYLRFISQNFDEISLEMEEQKIDWKSAVAFQLSLLLLQIKRLALSTAPPCNGYPNVTDSKVLTSEVLHFITTHYSDPQFSMKSISEELHISASSLSRSFHDVTGTYFSDYLCLYRMRQALPLIAESAVSIEEIASRCGYHDMHSFRRQFKKITGLTPSEFQKQNTDHATRIFPCDKELNHILYTEIIENLQCGKRKAVIALVSQALEEGFPPEEILQEGLVRGMKTLGEKFQSNEIFVPEVLGAANAVNSCLEILKPYLSASFDTCKRCAVICTVKGDIHNIGKNLVRLMLEAAGIRCIDLGEDVSPQTVVDAVREHHPGLVCLSALLTTTMMVQKDIIDALCAAGLRQHVKIIIGGAPVTQEFADRIGADAYTPDAVTAAQVAKRLLADMEHESSEAP